MTQLQAALRDKAAKTWSLRKEWYRCGFKFSDTRKQVCKHCESLNIYRNHSVDQEIWCWDCGHRWKVAVKRFVPSLMCYKENLQQNVKSVFRQGRWVAKVKKTW